VVLLILTRRQAATSYLVTRALFQFAVKEVSNWKVRMLSSLNMSNLEIYRLGAIENGTIR